MSESNQTIADDGSNVVGDGEKLSVAQNPKSKPTDGILVDSNETQVVIGTKPRAGLSVSIAATDNVAHTEVIAALEEIKKEVKLTRQLLPSHGLQERHDVDDQTTDRHTGRMQYLTDGGDDE